MSVIPIPEVDETDSSPPPDDETIRRRAIPVEAAPVPPAARAIPSSSPTEDLENQGLQSHLARAIPMTPAPPEVGSTEDLENRHLSDVEHPKSAPSQTGVASLWTKAQNIHNPVLRVLGEIGAGGARALDTIGSIAAPRIAAEIPGTTMNQRATKARDANRESQQAAVEGKQAETAHTQAETGAIPATVAHTEAQTKALSNPPEKQGLTPEETTLHDLMTGGENGQPQVNPATQKPYSYLEAYQAMKQAGQDVKPTPERKTNDVTRVVNGVPHVVKVDAATGEDVKDLGQTKIPQDASGKTDARSDKSYSYNNDKLDKLGTPIESAVGRLGRLKDTLASGTPQADALIAPELLTVMAGGAGSGLRMNEAEIQRIVGGRSKWESLKASINQWKLDPSKADSITADQRKQIHALVAAVDGKLQSKAQILDAAREKLLDSDDPKDHRRIVTDAHHSLTQIDEGGHEEGIKVTAPNGKSYSFKDQASADNFKKEAGIK